MDEINTDNAEVALADKFDLADLNLEVDTKHYFDAAQSVPAGDLCDKFQEQCQELQPQDAAPVSALNNILTANF